MSQTFTTEKERLLNIILERSFQLGDFTLSSGKKSDYYIDCRTTTLHPEGAYLCGRLLFELARPYSPDAVGGLTLGADPVVAAVIAESFRQGAPMRGFIVRKQEKSHGRGRRIEGCLAEGDSALIVEDVITTGGSALKAVDAARDAGAKVSAVLAIVDREEGGSEAITAEVQAVESLFTASELKRHAK
ncbi:MAG: orotate phosphoribosyltransferase [bacterium]